MTAEARTWRGSIREGFIVVVSILIAFGLDAWWDRRVEARELEEQLVALVDDFRTDNIDLRFRLDVYRRIQSNVVMLEGLVASSLGGGTIGVADSLLVASLSAPTYDPAISTLDAMVASGRVGGLRDPSLRRMLAGWSAMVVDAREDQDAANRVVHSRLIPILSEDTRLDRVLSHGQTWLDESVVSDQSEPVRPSVELLNALSERSYWNRFVLIELGMLVARQDSILSALDEMAR